MLGMADTRQKRLTFYLGGRGIFCGGGMKEDRNGEAENSHYELFSGVVVVVVAVGKEEVIREEGAILNVAPATLEEALPGQGARARWRERTSRSQGGCCLFPGRRMVFANWLVAIMKCAGASLAFACRGLASEQQQQWGARSTWGRPPPPNWL